MNAELAHRIKYELALLKNAKHEYTSRFDLMQNYKESFLRRTKIKGRYYYYIKRPGSDKYKYVGRAARTEVERIQEARFLKEAIRRIDSDIDLMSSLLKGFLPFDPSSISESLPKTYRCEVPPVSELYMREGAKWQAGRIEFQKRFPENYPLKKGHSTSDGVKVKTVSELLLYEKFKDAGLFQVYELPLPMPDYGPPLYPDFTILSPVDMKTEIIVEFVGRLDKIDYRDDFAKRLGRYINAGYIPGVNLFFVYGDRDGKIDSSQINKVIADIMGLC